MASAGDPLPRGYEMIDHDGIDVPAAHAYLTRSYWAEGITLATVRKAVAGSVCVGVRFRGAQVAFARVITDRATFAYLADVYVLEEHQRQGLGHAMLDYLDDHCDLRDLPHWAVFTRDAQKLYAAHGFTEFAYPEQMMIRNDFEPHK